MSKPSPTPPTPAATPAAEHAPGGPERAELVHVLMIALLFAAPTIIPVLASIAVRDLDVWWHLATGRWIVENGAIPFVDPFVTGASQQAWAAYSWLYEVFMYAVYTRLGLPGLFVYGCIMSLAVTGALYCSMRRAQPRLTVAVLLTSLVLLVTWEHQGVRTFLVSMLLLTVELDVLLTVRRTGSPRRLLLLPPLFALWANLHIQFVYGLLILGLALLEAAVDAFARTRSGRARRSSFPLGWTAAIAAVSLLATLFNPYTWQLYRVVYDLAAAPEMWRHVLELRAPDFRAASHWALLGLSVTAAFALGWRRELRPFPILLLAVGAFISFRAIRDVWLLAVVAAAVLAESGEPATAARAVRLGWARTAATAGLVLAMIAGAGTYRLSAGTPLDEVIAERFPADAADFIERSGLGGAGDERPVVYNPMDWGGYLLWRLPGLQVSMDGRIINFPGDALERSVAAWAGRPRWEDDRVLMEADVVVGGVAQALSELLRRDRRFELVYEDDVAVVFVPTERVAAVEENSGSEEL